MISEQISQVCGRAGTAGAGEKFRFWPDKFWAPPNSLHDLQADRTQTQREHELIDRAVIERPDQGSLHQSA